MVGVAQLVEHFAVAEVVGSSNLLAHPANLKSLYLKGFLIRARQCLNLWYNRKNKGQKINIINLNNSNNMTENYNQYNANSTNQPLVNTSGQGSSAPVPKEIKGWNWGAFLLTWIWGLFHHVWLSFLVFIPYVGFVIAIILGIKGAEWAWQAQRYGSIEEFKRRERKWTRAALIIILVIIIPILFATMILVIHPTKMLREACAFQRIFDLNPSDCNKIPERNIKAICYIIIIKSAKDPSICDKIQDQDFKNGCYSGVARAKQDLSICDKIQNQNDKDGCYSVVAQAKQDSSICDKIKSQGWKDGCYKRVGIAKQDLSICDKIESQRGKGECYKSIQH